VPSSWGGPGPGVYKSTPDWACERRNPGASDGDPEAGRRRRTRGRRASGSSRSGGVAAVVAPDPKAMRRRILGLEARRWQNPGPEAQRQWERRRTPRNDISDASQTTHPRWERLRRSDSGSLGAYTQLRSPETPTMTTQFEVWAADVDFRRRERRRRPPLGASYGGSQKRGDGSTGRAAAPTPCFMLLCIHIYADVGFYDIYFSSWICFHILSIYDISIHILCKIYWFYALSCYLIQCVFGVRTIYAICIRYLRHTHLHGVIQNHKKVTTTGNKTMCAHNCGFLRSKLKIFTLEHVDVSTS
jgi:hypothetical protein